MRGPSRQSAGVVGARTSPIGRGVAGVGWGAAVAAAVRLLPGCAGSSAPPPSPPAVEPPAALAPSPTAALAPAAPSLGEPVFVGKAPREAGASDEPPMLTLELEPLRRTPPPPDRDWAGTATLVPMGERRLVHLSFWQSMRLSGRPFCPLSRPAPGQGCGLYAVLGSKQPRSPSLLPTPAGWAFFAESAGAVLAAREGRGLVVDRIDAEQRVTPYLAAPEVNGWKEMRAVELPSGRSVLVGLVESYDHPETLQLVVGEAVAGEGGAARTLGPLTELDVEAVDTDTDEWRISAQRARAIEERGRRALYQPFGAVALRDEPGDAGAWALAWVQALPPPPSWPEGRPYRRPDKRGAKHGCGKSSRSLADRSVEKRLHITRFSGAKPVSDQVVERGVTFDARKDTLVVESTERGVVVNGSTYDRSGRRVGTRPVDRRLKPPVALELPVFPPEKRAQIDLAGFDPVAGRGLVHVVGEEAALQAFDARGELVGAATSLPNLRAVSLGAPPDTWEIKPGYVAAAGGTWFGVDPTFGFAAALTGPLVGRGVAESRASKLSLDHSFSLFFDGPSGPAVALRQRPDGQGSSYAIVPLKLDPLSWGEPGPASLAEADAGGPLRAVSSVLLGPGKPGVVGIVEGEPGSERLVTATLGEGGKWQAPSEPLPAWLGDKPSLSLHAVHGDVVAVVAGNGRAVARWLLAGGTVELPDSAVPAPFHRVSFLAGDRLSAPLLEDGTLLPDRPGPPLPAPLLRGVMNRCPYVFPSVPGQYVLVCQEPLDTSRQMVRVSLRRYAHPQGGGGPDAAP